MTELADNIEYSPGTTLVWWLAMLEARAATYDQILPTHFLLALCRVGEMQLTTIYDDGPRELIPHMPTLQAEIGTLRRVWRSLELDTEAICRDLRATLGTPGRAPQDGVWHRAPELKRLCAAAARCQGVGDGTPLAPVYLLCALAGDTSGEWWPTLAAHGVTPRRMQEALPDCR